MTVHEQKVIPSAFKLFECDRTVSYSFKCSLLYTMFCDVSKHFM